MRTPPQFFTALQRQQREGGLSLIELMVAITIGLLVVLALMAAFINFSRNSRELAKSNSMIENGRLAIHALQNDLQHAGFWGGHVPQFDNLAWAGVPADVPGAVPDVCLSYDATNWNADYKNGLIGIPLQVYAAAPASCSTAIANQKASSDILVVRHAATCMPGEPYCEADTAGKLYFQASRCSTDALPYVLSDSGFDRHNMDCATAAPKRKFVSNIYYIRDYAKNPGDGMPTLVRSAFDLASGTLAHPQAVALIEGIEGMRVEIGVDSIGKTGAAVNYAGAIAWQDPANKTTPTNRGDGTADGDFVSCTSAMPCSAEQLTNAVVAKIHLLARNLEPTLDYVDTKTYHLGTTTLGPFNDNFKRHVFSTTVRLVNVSARRETP